jgi:uncharacterized membrane protein YdjX (TVP38/TMEM64 family)
VLQEVFDRLQAAHWMAGGFWFRDSVFFCAFLAVSQLLLFPVTPFAVVAGFVLGFPKAALLVFCAKLVSAALNFTVSRHVARSWVQRLAARSHLLSSLHETVGEVGFKDALLMRLSPIPFAMLNYGCGLTTLGPATFLGSAAIGCLSSTMIFCGLGASFRETFLPLNESGIQRSPWHTGVMVISILASLWLLRDFSKKAMQRFKARQSSGTASPPAKSTSQA